MQIIFDLFNLLFFGPIVNIIVLVLRFLESVGIPGALGFSIIIMTVLIRLATWPLMATQLKSAKKMADIKPHLDALKVKHKDDKQGLASAQMALYKEHGINPAGGCLPTIIQIPPLIAIYQVIFSFFSGQGGLDRINHVLYFPEWTLKTAPDLHFFGLYLADKPSDFVKVGFFVLLVPVLTALLQFMQSRMMAPKPVKKYPSDSPKEKKEKEDTDEAMQAVQSQMMYMMPLIIAYASYTLPVGLAFYWNTLTLLGIWQQYRISGWGSLSPLVNKLTGKKN